MHNSNLEPKVHFESKLILIQRLDKEYSIKSMYIEYITYNFSMTMGPHVCDSWNISKQKEIKKIMQCPFIKSPPFDMVMVFSWKEDVIMHSLLKKCKNTLFLMDFHPKVLNL